MRKIVLVLCAILIMPLFSYGDEIQNIRAFFDSYVNAANTYSKTIPDFYLDNARIFRVVLKKDGTKQSVEFPMIDYKKQMEKSEKIAKFAGYKNNYKNITVTKLGGDYKLSAMRYPNKDKRGLFCYFVITKTANGYKIKVESMDTPVQDFLKYANR